jgi:hypothetical protein
MCTQVTGSREEVAMATQEAQLEDSRASSPSDTRVQVLLKEYEISRINADHLEDSIWKTAAVFVSASIAGLGLLGGTIPESPRLFDYMLRAGIAVVSIVLVYWWKKMASVWYFVQNMLYFRVVEIEEELDLYSESYISYIDRALRGEKYPERPRVNAMISTMKAQYRPLSVPRTVDRIGWVLIVVWLVFLASQVAAMLGWI